MVSLFISSMKSKHLSDHVICNEFQVSRIDVDIISSENITDFLQYDGSCHLHAISLKGGEDIVGVNCIQLDDFLGE